MDLRTIGDLLQVIAVNYPTFARHIADGDGRMRKDVAEEWLRQIGFLDYNEAIARLDMYMASEAGSRVPKPMDLKKARISKSEVFLDRRAGFQRIDNKGQLIDDEGRIYAYPDRPDEVYHYDDMGRIVDSHGKLAQ